MSNVTTITVSLERPLDAAKQIETEANRLAEAFAFCTAEENAKKGVDSEGPIWQTIRDLRAVSGALYDTAKDA